MAERDILNTLEEPKRLIENEYYFRYIFKKTEKIVSAVFYILTNKVTEHTSHAVVHDLEESALRTLASAGSALSLREGEGEEAMRGLVLELTLLESRLRLLVAAGLLTDDQMHVFAAEIDTAIRAVRNMHGSASARQKDRTADRRPTIVQGSTPTSPRASVAAETTSDRRSRILAVLRAQPGVSIKDISDTVKDVSEKTIQRELNDMIKDGLAVREGEKRWSRYSVV